MGFTKGDYQRMGEDHPVCCCLFMSLMIPIALCTASYNILSSLFCCRSRNESIED